MREYGAAYRNVNSGVFEVENESSPEIQATVEDPVVVESQSESPVVRRHGWQKGQSGNPKGRPKGTQTRVEREFLSGLCEDFQAHGQDAIARAREANPALYLKAITSLFAKGPVTVVIGGRAAAC